MRLLADAPARALDYFHLPRREIGAVLHLRQQEHGQGNPYIECYQTQRHSQIDVHQVKANHRPNG